MSDGIVSPFKECRKCKRSLPRSTAYFFREATNGDGLQGTCKECKGYQFTPPPPEGHKKCSVCKNLKLYAEFHKDSTSNDGLSYTCIICARKRSKDHYWDNRDEHLAYNKQYKADNRERIIQYLKNWRADNPHKAQASIKRWIVNNRERKQAKQREWDRANRIRINVIRHNRRARVRQLPYSFVAEDWQRCLAYWNYRCCACGRTEDAQHIIAMDHWIPIADPRPDNPGTVPQNIIPLCHARKGASDRTACNQSKWMHDPLHWLQKRYGTEQAATIANSIQAYFDWLNALMS